MGVCLFLIENEDSMSAALLLAAVGLVDMLLLNFFMKISISPNHSIYATSW